MANTDSPNGFTPVKTLSGRPLEATIRTVGVADGEDIFVGDTVTLVSGLAAPGDTTDTAFLGVAAGFGKVDADGVPLGPYNPDSLLPSFYDDSASTHTEWVCYYYPPDDVIFEAQTDAAVTLVVGDTRDLLGTTGNTLTGRSKQEIDADGTTTGELTVVEIPKKLDSTAGGYNDATAAFGRYYVMITRANQAFHA